MRPASATLAATIITAPTACTSLSRQAPHDPGPFIASVKRQLSSARRYGMQPAVLMISVEAHGAFGRPVLRPSDVQELMQMLRNPLRSQLRGSDLLAQVGPQRFGVLLADALPTAVAGIGARLERPAGWPDHLQAQPVLLKLRSGASVKTGDSPAWLDADAMVLAAEHALRARLA
jgi:GGDEF domain-containing protein